MGIPAAEFVSVPNFDLIRRSGAYYLDKTRFIKDIVSAADVHLITRPRRFGKSLTSSMLQNFLEMDYTKPADRTRQEMLFAGLDILQDEMFCEEWMGKWPVLSVS